jgi:RNA polymerase sigma factor (sigma-70 family)
MRACREGGSAIAQALRELDRSFFAVLYEGGLRTLRDPDAARDLVQETFIKVWQRCASFRGDSELLPWIKAILRNAAIERLRQRTREVPMEDDHGLTEDAARHLLEISTLHNPTPDQIARRREHAECFRAGWTRFLKEDPVHANVMAWVVEDVSQCRKRARRYLSEWYALARDTGHVE